MEPKHNEIAIVGMAGKFPEAENVTQFWQNLLDKKECIKFFSDEELENYELNYQQLKNDPHYIKARGVLSNVDQWDAQFFGYSPLEASFTDPQQRLWLETAWHAFEDAACDPFSYQGAIGVFAGAYQNTYLLNNILRDPLKYENYIRSRTSENFQTYLNNDPGFIASRTAYIYNLKGPAIYIQTACSTSLVAVIQACNSLLTGESDTCLAGGVCIVNPQETGYLFQEGAISSSDGHCKPFDKDGKGTIFSNGLGIVVLKRLEDAIKDGNRIYAVIKGWALNNDGNQKIGYTAPSIDGQVEAITKAQQHAGIQPGDFSYIEAHGTATPLGDPIEVTALTKAFRTKTDKVQFCGLGSVKSNMGHLDAAAGIAGIMKIALSAYHHKIPATLHYKEANPNIDFKNSPFYVVNELLECDNEKPLVLGVSSFGIGGTNAHVIVSDYQQKTTKTVLKRPDLYLLSAQSDFSLGKAKENLVGHLSANPNINKAQVTYTLQNGRSHLKLRSYAVAMQGQPVEISLFTDGQSSSATKDMVFMFPGQGAQFVSMGQNLYETEPIFKSVADECFSIFEEITGTNLKSILFAQSSEEAETKLAQTQYTQPALFITEYATAQLYIHYGIRPKACIGHSIGEYVAACVSGVFDLKSALSIVVKRGQLMQSMPEGNMMAVKSTLSALKELPMGIFEIAASNSPGMCTISFQPENAEKVKELLEQKGLNAIPLNTSHAFHSQAFDPILEEFFKYVNTFTRNKPQIPFISCLTGDYITNEQATSGIYWAKQLRNTVLFSKGIEKLATSENVVFLEVGPNTHLSGQVRQNDAVKSKSLIIKSIGKMDSDTEQVRFYKSLGELWLKGVCADFHKFYDNENPGFISLPEYPFEHKRYWIDYTPNKSVISSASNSEIHLTEKENTEVSLKDSVKSVLTELSGYQSNEIKDERNFEDFGFDSLFLARFATALERKFKITIEFRKLVYEYPNINALTEYIGANSVLPIKEKESVANTNYKPRSYMDNFTPFQTEGNQTPLVMVHGDDLNIILPKLLGKQRPYYGYLHLSADGYRNPFNSVQKMAAHYVQQLHKYNHQKTYLLGGYSFGGVLAFEMALQLEKLGYNVPYLFLFESGTPEARIRYDDKKAESEASEAPKLFQQVVYLFQKYYYKVYYKSIRMIRNAYFLVFNRLPVDYRRPYVYDIYTNLARKNKIEGRFKGKLVVFRASENGSDLKYLGWEKYADNILESILLRGNHDTIIKNEDSIELIREKVSFYLAQYQKEVNG
jgi:acyl transferase domain-containing protein/thioesterase domain-containing protein